MAIQGRQESSDGKRRAVLLLSLILLVWNAGATGYCVNPVGVLSSAYGSEDSAPLPFASGRDTIPLTAESPRSGSLTLRQKYLLGKRVDINNAPPNEISELPGISDKVAAAVVEERVRIGRFRTFEDLLGVNGIKEKRLKKILPFLAKIPNN